MRDFTTGVHPFGALGSNLGFLGPPPRHAFKDFGRKGYDLC
jgi:hypothetical protein